MAEVNGTFAALSAYTSPVVGFLRDGTTALLTGGEPVGPGITDYFKMRCRDSGLAPPGYVVWVVTGAPDDDASEAPLVGTASDIMVMSSWQI